VTDFSNNLSIVIDVESATVGRHCCASERSGASSAPERTTRTGGLAHLHAYVDGRSSPSVDGKGIQLRCFQKRVSFPNWFNADRAESLLEEPAIALWASEAATKYEVSISDALEFLAFALFMDGEK
jgi:hypothetical protein